MNTTVRITGNGHPAVQIGQVSVEYSKVDIYLSSEQPNTAITHNDSLMLYLFCTLYVHITYLH